MSFNGSGVFNINTSGQPVASGTVISSTAFNLLTADLANGLTLCITKDGQSTPTANIPMGNNRIITLANGLAATDAATLGQVQSSIAKLLTSVTGADTITAVASPTLAAYTLGQMFYFVAAGANTTTVTINIDSLGAKSITRDGTTALAAGDIQSGEICVIVYDGTQFQLVNGASQSASIVTENLTVNKATVLNESGGDNDTRIEGDTDANLFFADASTDRVGIGTNTPATKLDVDGATIVRGLFTPTNAITMGGNVTAPTADAFIFRPADNTLAFGTANAERCRVTSGGDLLVGKTSSSVGTVGVELGSNGRIIATTSGIEPMILNRGTDDGTLIEFRQANISEGTISVSGNTISYNPFMGSHYTEIVGTMPTLKGTVLESLDELVQGKYSSQDRLPKAKISDTVGSSAVYGVYFSPDSDTETDDGILAAALGASWVRIASGVTVHRGDLLESNGDGCAKVQSDDIIRSKTIGKVTSTTVADTYADGSYIVPCVLYCG